MEPSEWSLPPFTHIESGDIIDRHQEELISAVTISDKKELHSNDDTNNRWKKCDSCSVNNISGANWCIECGVALLGKPNVLDQRKKEINQSQKDKIHPWKDDALKSNFEHDYPDASSQLLFSDPSLQNIRHWETSKSYSWRKPQSHVFHTISAKKVTVVNNSNIMYKSFVPILNLADESISSTPRSEKSSFTILNLPDEILLQVLSHLKQADLFNCMLSCKVLNYLTRDRTLWKTVKLHKIKSVNQNTIQQVALKFPRHLEIIECQGSLDVHDVIELFDRVGNTLMSIKIEMSEFGSYIGDVILLNAATKCTHLSSISIDWLPVSERALAKTIQSCHCLKELCIKHPKVSSSNLGFIISHHSLWLRKLDVESTNVTEVLKATKQRKLVAMESFTSLFNVINMNIVKEVTSAFPQLRAIYIHCTVDSQIWMHEAVKELRNIPLHTIYFKSCAKSLDVFCCSLINHMCTLRSFCANCLDDEQLQILCQGSLNLDILDLSGSFVTDKCFSSIIDGSFCSSLRCFKINNCDAINRAAIHKTVQSFSDNWKGRTMAEEIRHVINSCRRLRIIELRGIYCAHELDSVDCKPCAIIH